MNKWTLATIQNKKMHQNMIKPLLVNEEKVGGIIEAYLTYTVEDLIQHPSQLLYS